MKKASIAFLAVAALLVATSASAQYTIGGRNQTSENFGTGGVWSVLTTATPGTVPGGLLGSSNDLLLTEYAFTGNNQEFVEIYNPTGSPISLDNVYLSDDFFVTTPGGYYNVVLGAGYTIGTTSDYAVKFPVGTAAIASGEVIVVWMGAAAGSPFAYALPGGTRLFQVAGPAVGGATLMVPLGNTPSNANGLMTNGGEFAVLFRWDGISDVVCDIDYVVWAAPSAANPKVDKTGVSVDGPDAGATPTAYLADTAAGSQPNGLTHVAGGSVARTTVGAESSPGNGCIPGGPTPTHRSTWGSVKSIYR